MSVEGSETKTARCKENPFSVAFGKACTTQHSGPTGYTYNPWTPVHPQGTHTIKLVPPIPLIGQ